MIQKKIKIIKNKETRLIFLRDMSLMLAMFFLPFGYDALFKLIMEITKSYWTTDIIFYVISGCFWLSYFLIDKIIKKKNTHKVN
jgi:hypothetical protein